MGRQRQRFSVELFRQVSEQQVWSLLCTAVGRFVHDLDFTKVHIMAWPASFFVCSFFHKGEQSAFRLSPCQPQKLSTNGQQEDWVGVVVVQCCQVLYCCCRFLIFLFSWQKQRLQSNVTRLTNWLKLFHVPLASVAYWDTYLFILRVHPPPPPPSFPHFPAALEFDLNLNTS